MNQNIFDDSSLSQKILEISVYLNLNIFALKLLPDTTNLAVLKWSVETRFDPVLVLMGLCHSRCGRFSLNFDEIDRKCHENEVHFY